MAVEKPLARGDFTAENWLIAGSYNRRHSTRRCNPDGVAGGTMSDQLRVTQWRSHAEADRQLPSQLNSKGIARSGSPRSDAGTVLLHWLSAGTLLVSLLTGIRIAAEIQRRSSPAGDAGPSPGRNLDVALPCRARALLLWDQLSPLHAPQRSLTARRSEAAEGAVATGGVQTEACRA